MMHNFLESLIYNPTWEKGIILLFIMICMFWLPEVVIILAIICKHVLYPALCKGLKLSLGLIVMFSLAIGVLYVYNAASYQKESESELQIPETQKFISPYRRRHSA